MKALKIDMNKFAGAKFFKAKDGTDHIAIPIDANNIYRGEKGLYCSITLMDNRDGVDDYGNEGFATVDIGKDRRLAGEKGPILGNWKTIGQPAPRNSGPGMPPAPSQTATADALDEGDDEIPF